MREERFDVLILGSGGAGLFAALRASARAPNARVALVAKGLIGKCGCTRMVQGGYNVALGDDDSVERHFMDTIWGGKWLPDQDMAWRLCATAPERIAELENEIGCFFDRAPDGTVRRKAFAGQTADRTVHKGDLTGIEIVNRLMEQALAREVRALHEHRALELIPSSDGSAIAGVLMLDIRTGELFLARAEAVLLATGGGPTMYKHHTPSGDKSMDGLAMALRAGLSLRDMEMVQFHPTGLLAGRETKMTGTVLEEGLRGAGGHLLDAAGDRFMFDYDERGERATRDIVSRAMFERMQTGAVGPNGGVFIQMSHLGAEFVAERFQGMVRRCADCGFDLARGRVEVAPTAHYFMGGVVVDPDARTALEGLYCAGEDAGGAHGANRLGGNGVANSTVFGAIAGDRMAADLRGALREPDRAAIEAGLERAMRPFARPAAPLRPLRARLEEIMWDDVGVVRERAALERGLARIAELRAELRSIGAGAGPAPFDLTWQSWLDLDSLIDASEAIAHAALARDNSRGAHFRADHPEEGDLDASYFTVIRRVSDALRVDRAPVAFTMVRPGESLLKGEEEAQ